MAANTPIKLRKVAWRNVWTYSIDGDTREKMHLTTDEGLSGKTLCGRHFPKDKGYPTAWYGCRRCYQIARKKFPDVDFSTLAWVGKSDE